MANKQVPFNKEGDMMGYPDYEWRIGSFLDINTEFKAKMQYDSYSRGRSSIKLHFIDLNTNKNYEMFMTEFDRIMNLGLINSNSYLSGIFGFHKKGKNFGLRFIKED